MPGVGLHDLAADDDLLARQLRGVGKDLGDRQAAFGLGDTGQVNPPRRARRRHRVRFGHLGAGWAAGAAAWGAAALSFLAQPDRAATAARASTLAIDAFNTGYSPIRDKGT